MKKKLCRMCGQEFSLGHFYHYRLSDGRKKVMSYCKECQKKRSRVYYDANVRRPDIKKLDDMGRPVYKRKLWWGEQKVRDFKRLFPVTSNDDLAIMFRCCSKTVRNRAKEYGLVKDSDYISQVCHTKGMHRAFISKLHRS